MAKVEASIEDDQGTMGVEMHPEDEAQVTADPRTAKEGDGLSELDMLEISSGEDGLPIGATETEQASDSDAKTEEKAAKEEPEKEQVDTVRKQEWDKERQKSDERAANAEKALIGMTETVKGLVAEVSSLKDQIAAGPATAEQKADMKDELDGILQELEGDYTNEATAKAFKAITQRLRAIQSDNIGLKAANAALKAETDAIKETEAGRLVREKQAANAAAYNMLLDEACRPDEIRKDGWEDRRNAIKAAIVNRFEGAGFGENNLPDENVMVQMRDAAASEVKMKWLLGQKAPKPQAPAPASPKKGVVVEKTPPEDRKGRGPMSLRNKVAEMATRLTKG